MEYSHVPNRQQREVVARDRCLPHPLRRGVQGEIPQLKGTHLRQRHEAETTTEKKMCHQLEYLGVTIDDKCR